MNMADLYYTDYRIDTKITGETDRFTRYLIYNSIKTGVIAQTMDANPGLELCPR